MRYIVRLAGMPSEQEINIVESVSKIFFVSKILPVVLVEADQPQILASIPFVKALREPNIGRFQDGEFLSTIIFEPTVIKKPLNNNQFYGWGDTRIFVLDSGVNEGNVNIAEHRDFSGTGIRDNKNHGTIVAKIIKHFTKGAVIYSGKIGNIYPDEFYLFPALEWGFEKGAKIINISAGFKRDKKKPCNGDCDLCELVNIISSKGILVVVAAGNDDQKIDSIECPGRASESITVGAIDNNFKTAEYSSIGKPGGIKPNMVTSGMVHIDGVPYRGTSFAAPIISGVLGAVLSKVGNVFRLKEYLYNTLVDLGLPQHHQGKGYLDIEKFVEVIVNETSDSKSQGQNQTS